VGRVESVRIRGLDLWFNSHDHLPPHVHVRKRATWEIRVYFLLTTPDDLEYQLKWGRKLRTSEIRTIRAAIGGHKVELLSEWEKKVCRS
jgi:uncharacterized protein DUF4160